MKFIQEKLLFIFFIFVLVGCSIIFNYQELRTLKKIGKSQKEIGKGLESQESLFYKLREDLKNNRLKKGTARKEILSIYGEPVLVKESKEDKIIKRVFLYRHPTDYFSSDRIYLYFDFYQKLNFWELKPAAEGKQIQD